LSKTARKAGKPQSPLSFIDYLETRLRETPPAQKGARTRERLKIATAKMLESNGYHAMRVVDITQAAGVAEGSFYVYFNDKKEASLTALSSFIEDFVNNVAPTAAVNTAFDSIRIANRRWLALCQANAGLMRCVFQVSDEDRDFARLVQQAMHKWYVDIAKNICFERRHADSKAVLLAIYLLGSMMDELVRKLIIFPDDEFLKLLRQLGADHDAVADAASLIWIRVFGSPNEPLEDLPAPVESLSKLLLH